MALHQAGPSQGLPTLCICAFSIPAPHRVQELNLEEKQAWSEL